VTSSLGLGLGLRTKFFGLSLGLGLAVSGLGLGLGLDIGSMLFRFVTKHACDRRIDRQTDGQRDRQTDGQNYDPHDRASISASRGKNWSRVLSRPRPQS